MRIQQLIPYLGVPGTMLVVLVWALAKGWLITGREVAKDLQGCQDVEEDLRKRLAERDREWQERYELMTQEKNFWRDAALKNLEILETATKTAKAASEKLRSK